jgi:hypothetical protein
LSYLSVAEAKADETSSQSFFSVYLGSQSCNGPCPCRFFPAAGSHAPRLSIAVLPFTNLGDKVQDYFVDAITESLTTDLSRISGAFVIARNTVMASSHSRKACSAAPKRACSTMARTQCAKALLGASLNAFVVATSAALACSLRSFGVRAQIDTIPPGGL